MCVLLICVAHRGQLRRMRSFLFPSLSFQPPNVHIHTHRKRPKFEDKEAEKKDFYSTTTDVSVSENPFGSKKRELSRSFQIFFLFKLSDFFSEKFAKRQLAYFSPLYLVVNDCKKSRNIWIAALAISQVT